MAKYHGKKGVVYLAATGSSGNATLVLGITDWSFDRSTDTVDVTSFGASNKAYVQGLPDAKGDFNGFYMDDESKPFSAAASADGARLYLYPSSDAPSKYIAAPCWMSVSINAAIRDAVKIKGTWVANGDVTINL